MKSDNTPVFKSDPPPILLKKLTIRTLNPEEMEQADKLLSDEHYLGPSKAKGRCVVQAIEYEGRWVALLDWGPAALKLADRDEWIGWDNRQRADRRGLVVMNRRFLVLSQARMPNLASRCLSMALKALPGQWEQAHGYRPLLAETFTDPEQFEGTCYKASNWLQVGQTKGYKRGHRLDYYVEHGRPKHLWVYPLHPRSREILQSFVIPQPYQGGVNLKSPERDLPLKRKQVDSLREAFGRVPDPRKRNRSYKISSLLCLVAMGLMAGRKNLSEIHRYGQFLTTQQRKWLGWPKESKGVGYKAPSYNALYNLLRQLDPHLFAATLTQWMEGQSGSLPRALALDGKYVSDKALTLCLSEHETGSPVAVAVADDKPRTEDNKKDGELTVSKKLLGKSNLDNAVVTCDALYDAKPIARTIVEEGGDYLIQTKDPRRESVKTAQKLEGTPTPFLTTA